MSRFDPPSNKVQPGADRHGGPRGMETFTVAIRIRTLPAMTFVEVIAHLVATGVLELKPMYGFGIRLTFTDANFSREGSVQLNNAKRVDIYTQDGFSVDTSLPLREGIHRINITKGEMEPL